MRVDQYSIIPVRNTHPWQTGTPHIPPASEAESSKRYKEDFSHLSEESRTKIDQTDKALDRIDEVLDNLKIIALVLPSPSGLAPADVGANAYVCPWWSGYGNRA